MAFMLIQQGTMCGSLAETLKAAWSPRATFPRTDAARNAAASDSYQHQPLALYTAAVYKENSARWRFCDYCSEKSTVLYEFDEQRT